MDQRYYIYIITNTLTCKSYVGSRMYGKKEPYLGSSKYLKADIKEYGLWNFSKSIIGFYPFIDKKELYDRETQVIKDFNTLSPNGYNRNLPNNYLKFYAWNKGLTNEIDNRVKNNSEKRKGFHHTEEAKQSMRIKNKDNGKYRLGKHHSEETKLQLQVPKSEETKENMKRGCREYWKKKKSIDVN